MSSVRGGRSNRGPAAAAENRDAILEAARRLFAGQGYHVPLSAIAKEAGVGQGVLYRHFPNRLDLALAAFEDHFTELEEIAAAPDAFVPLWRRLVELMIAESAFIEMAVDARRTAQDYDGDARLRRLLEPAVAAAHDAGRIPASMEVQDLVLLLRAVHGVSVTSDNAEQAARAAARLLELSGLPT